MCTLTTLIESVQSLTTEIYPPQTSEIYPPQKAWDIIHAFSPARIWESPQGKCKLFCSFCSTVIYVVFEHYKYDLSLYLLL